MGKIIIPPIVLIKETIDKFGYDPNSFKGINDYTKEVVRTCFICFNIYDQKFINVIRSFKNNKKCKFCANKIRAKANSDNQSKLMKAKLISGEIKPPMLGKKHSEETKTKISKKNCNKIWKEIHGNEKTEFLKKEMSNRTIGAQNPFFGKMHSKETIEILKNVVFTDERKEKIGNFRRNKTFEELYGDEKAKELKKKISIRTSGKNNPAFGKMYNSKKGFVKIHFNGYNFRSSWEYKVAKYFNDNNIKFEFESKCFNLGETTYRPDFYLLEENRWIEVKGFWYEDAIIKFELFKQLYPEIKIEVWDKEKLKELNLI